MKAVLFILTLVITTIFSRLGLDYHHQGIMFNGAISFFSNEGLLYRDFYYHYGPLTALIHAGSMLIWGKKLIALQNITCIAYSIISVQLYDLNREFFKSKLSAIIVLVTIALAPYYIWVFIPWSSVLAIPFFILIFKTLLHKEKKYSSFILAFSSVAILFIRQSSGILIFPILALLFIITKDRKYYLNSIKIYLTLLIFSLIILFTTGVLPYYVKIAFINQFGFLQSATTSDTSSSLYSLFSSIIHSFILGGGTFSPFLFFNLSFILLSVFALCMIIELKKPITQNIYLPIALFSSISLIQMFPISCDRHYYWALLPTFPFLAEIINQMIINTKSRQFNRNISIISILVLTTSLMSEITLRTIMGYKRIQSHHEIKIPNMNVIDKIKINNLDNKILQQYSKNLSNRNSYLKTSHNQLWLLSYINIYDFKNIKSDTIFQLSNSHSNRYIDSINYFNSWTTPNLDTYNTKLYLSKYEYFIKSSKPL